MTVSLSNILILLFMIAVIAQLSGLTSTPIETFRSSFIALNQTSEGTQVSLSGTGFLLSLISTAGISIGVAGVLGIFSGQGALSQFTVVTSIALFMILNILPLPLIIFSDPSLPFAVKLIFGGSISILLMVAILEFFAGRDA